MGQLARGLRKAQHILRLRAFLEHQCGIVCVVERVMKGMIGIWLDAKMLHGGFQPCAVLGIAGQLAIEPLQVVHLRERLRIGEEIQVLLEYRHVVTAPGEQRAVPAAPGMEALRSLAELQRVAQLILADAGDAFDTRMELDIVGGLNQLVEGVDDLQPVVQLDRADLNHFKQQLAAHGFIGGAVVGERLVPFQIQDDVIHAKMILPMVDFASV